MVAVMSHFIQKDDEEQELARVLAKTRGQCDETGDLRQIHKVIEAEQNSKNEDALKVAERIFDKWRIIHKFIHARPFAVEEGLRRSDQWRFVQKKYAPLGEAGLDDWLALQVEIAANREKGLADLRIRRDGPCYLIVLEYVGNKKRTALAVLHWVRQEAKEQSCGKSR
jgi:hypothetical protein